VFATATCAGSIFPLSSWSSAGHRGDRRRPTCRGTLKPQMSASSTPTARPCAASAAARFTVTDDLPTPPFPPRDRDHAGGGADLGVGRRASRLRSRAPLHDRRGARPGSSPQYSTSTSRTPARPCTFEITSGLDLAPQRAARGGEGHLHLHVAVGGIPSTFRSIPRSTMLGPRARDRGLPPECSARPLRSSVGELSHRVLPRGRNGRRSGDRGGGHGHVQ